MNRYEYAFGLFAFGLCCGCASNRPAPAALPSAALPGLTRARQLAPDYAVRVDSAWQAAKRESTPEGQRDQLRRAQLLSLAAQAEAERVALVRQVPAYEARIERATLARAQAERARIALQRERVIAQSAALEQVEARWVFAALARGPLTKPQERDRAWTFLVRRAQALCAAARGLGAPASELTEADLQLTAARTAKLEARVAQARSAVSLAQRALGSARAMHEPRAATRNDLLERLRERGFVLSDERALVVDLSADLQTNLPPDLPRGPGPRARMYRVSLLDDLLPAFPHGPILLRCGRRAGCAAGWFAPGLRERVRVEVTGAEQADEVVHVLLPAYAGGSAAP